MGSTQKHKVDLLLFEFEFVAKVAFYPTIVRQKNKSRTPIESNEYKTSTSHLGPRPHRWWKEEALGGEVGLEYRGSTIYRKYIIYIVLPWE